MPSAEVCVILPKGPSCNQLSQEQSALGAMSRKEDSACREADLGQDGLIVTYQQDFHC